MALRDFPKQEQGVQVLQRSLERGRLAHGYLFTGHSVSELEALAAALAKTLNCRNPKRAANGAAIDSCDGCLSCRKIDHANHPDIRWIRPESKMRIIAIDQIRELIQEIQLKPGEAEYKVSVIVEADRLKTEAANAFLKTLEEPPPKSILILLTTDLERILETILSRCLRLTFGGDGPVAVDAAKVAWLTSFAEVAAGGQKSLISRYRLLDELLGKLTELREDVESVLKARSPLEQYEDAEKDLRERWEVELSAAVEAEYRRRRSDLLSALQWWLRDVWLRSLGDAAGQGGALLGFPQIAVTQQIARRVSPEHALENLEILEQLQRWLGTNVQEALALEVSLLKLHL
jgi:DNA polymerase-3 subunit delta'